MMIYLHSFFKRIMMVHTGIKKQDLQRLVEMRIGYQFLSILLKALILIQWRAVGIF